MSESLEAQRHNNSGVELDLRVISELVDYRVSTTGFNERANATS